MHAFPHCPGSSDRRRGYTLVELLVVLGIIGVIIGLTTYFLYWGMNFADELTEQAAAAQIPHMKRQAMADKGKLLAEIRNRHLVVLNNNAGNPQAVIAQMQQTIPLKVTHVYTSGIKGFAAVIPPASVAAVRSFPGVKYMGKDRIFRVAQEQVVKAPGTQTPSTGLRRINGLVDSAFGSHSTPGLGNGPRNIGGGVSGRDTTQVVVAVMDTGVDKTHPDLNVTFSKSFGAFDTTDAFGHGTHCAGVVGAVNNTIGVLGVCPGCKIWNLKVLDASGSGTVADIVNALDFVVQNAHTIRVVNMSFGGSVETPDDPINDAVTACWNAGVVMVAAAGNSSIDARGFSPASASGVICVGALCDMDGRGGGFGPNGPPSLSFFPAGDPDDTMASFSNFGPRVDILAPGVNIISTYPVALGSYYQDTGTSMAAPHVSGLAALIRSPALNNQGTIRNLAPTTPSTVEGSNLSPEQIKVLILQNVGAPRAKYTAIPGLVGNNDTRVYPVLNAGPF